MPPLPPVTKALMLICTAVFCVDLLLPLRHWLALQPIQGGAFMPWQPLTFALLHREPIELLLNLLCLWMFGADLERLWGGRRFGLFLLSTVLCAAVAALVLLWAAGGGAAASGASAALYGMLFGTAMLFPGKTIMPLFPPIPMKMKTFALVFGGIVFVLNLYAYRWLELAMLGAGVLGAWLHIRYWRHRGRSRPGPRRL